MQSIAPSDSIKIDDEKVVIVYYKTDTVNRIKIKTPKKSHWLLESKNDANLLTWMDMFTVYRCKVVWKDGFD